MSLLEALEALEARRMLSTATHLRIDCGGAGVTDSTGTVWSADRGFTAGTAAGPANDLYASRRVGDFSYSLPIKNGSYKVKLLFKEPTKTASGQRTFDVFAERKLVLNDFDIFAAAGSSNVIKSVTVKVSDGRLNLWFDSVKDQAVVSGIEVIPAAATINWRQLPDAPLTKFESMGDVVNGKLYVFGGYVNAKIQSTPQVAVYDPVANQWSTRRDMPEKLTHSGTANDAQFIYLAGGYVGDWQGLSTPVTRHVWRYDTINDAWTSVLSLPANRSAGGLVRVGRKLHFFGGLKQRKQDRGEHWVLDLRRPTRWAAAAAMPDPRNHLGAIETGGKIYAVGGQHDLNENSGNDAQVDAFDVVVGTWSRVADLPRPLSHTHNATFVRGGT